MSWRGCRASRRPSAARHGRRMRRVWGTACCKPSRTGLCCTARRKELQQRRGRPAEHAGQRGGSRRYRSWRGRQQGEAPWQSPRYLRQSQQGVGKKQQGAVQFPPLRQVRTASKPHHHLRMPADLLHLLFEEPRHLWQDCHHLLPQGELHPLLLPTDHLRKQPKLLCRGCQVLDQPHRFRRSEHGAIITRFVLLYIQALILTGPGPDRKSSRGQGDSDEQHEIHQGERIPHIQ